MLQHEGSIEHGRALERMDTRSICEVGQVPKIKHRGLRICTWNFQRLCSDRKALGIGEVLSKNHTDIIGSQESWELGNSKIYVPGDEWFGKPMQGEY